MPSLLVPSVPFYRNPELRPGLAALIEYLMDRRYSSHYIGKIFDYVAVNGTLAGCACLDREDEECAEAIFCDSLPAVAPDSDAWDREGVLFDVELLTEGNHPWPLVHVGDDDRTGPDLDIPPISGGSPEFEPSEEDWQDYRTWAEEVDRREELRWLEDHHNPMYGYE